MTSKNNEPDKALKKGIIYVDYSKTCYILI